MLKSMTAHGRGTFQSPLGHFVVEIQSVNRKFLDVSTQMPKELVRFEVELKKWMQSFISRGQVTIRVFASFDEIIPVVVRPNLPLARQLKQAWDAIAAELGLIVDSVDLNLIAHEDEILSFEENIKDEDQYREALRQAFEAALKGFQQMRFSEGLVMQQDVLARVEKMRVWIAMIDKKAPHATKKYREKLLARLEGLVPYNGENEERILREVALFAEKIDIAEEVTRFSCHLTHLEELTYAEDGGVGKTLEFVLQELSREINTVGSKSSDLEIARAVIDVKSELERIREQIQNVE